jgi:hypothetical protein
MAEINTSWKMVQPSDRLYERTWGWFPSLHISHAYAAEFPSSSAHQAGGTAIFAIGKAVHYVMEKSSDKWGRWCSTKFRGASEHTFRIISAYRCVRNIHGPLSVWNQLRYLMDLQRISDDPIERFDRDLCQFIQECMAAGEQVILGIDVNEDIRSGSFSKIMRDLGLKDICTHRHGPSNPSTYARGSTPIDAIYVTANLWSSRCGYLPVVSDHRVLWIDIPQEQLFGRRLSALPIRTPQRLILQDPRVVEKYITAISNQLQSVHFLDRLQSLRDRMEDKNCSNMARLVDQYNELDAIRCAAILKADRSCRKLKMGHVAFSPALSIVWNKIRAWKLIRRKKMGGRVSSRYLQREIKAAGLRDISNMTLNEVDNQLADAWKQYRRLKKQATSLRATWLEEVAAARASAGKLGIAQEIKNLMVRERQRYEARVIQNTLKAKNRRALSSVEILDASGNVLEFTSQTQMEEALLKELKIRFNQASNTPFQTDPLLRDLGPLGVSAAAKDVLLGRYSPPSSTDEWAAKLIPFLRQAIPTAPIVDLTPEQYAAGWKRVRERTSAGMSGITIPHMKAHGSSSFLSLIDSIMANLPYRFGFSPARWQRGLDVMIEKKPGVRLLSSLRAILLYEADFNQNNKRFGREALFRAEDANAVAIEQYGSRKHMSASDQSLNKALTFDIWRQLRQCGALCCNDAKACYDRISHNCASLCLQRVGAPEQPILSMFHSIQRLEHHVRTIFGESKTFFQQQGSVPLQGVGQGNGAGPQIWALVSTPVLNMLRAQGLGATFTSALTKLSTSLVGFAFVDDTDLVTSGPMMTLEEVKSRIQESLIAWEGGIRATGGAIEPKKSHWYLVDFDWSNGEPRYRSVRETNGKLQVRDPTGKVQTLAQLEPWHAERTLGVRLAPDGNMTAQFQWMLDTSKAWAEKIRAGHLPRHLTWLAWRTTIQKTLEYPLATTTLSKSQCDKLTSVIAQVALPRIGVIRSFPRALLHAPPKFAGLNIPNLYVEQGVSHILRLIRYSRSKNHSTGLLLRQTCEALKLELGTNGPLLSNSWSLAVLATDGWIKSTWQFASEFNIKICDDIPEFQPIRVYDQLLIPTFCRLGYRGQQLRLLNQCRLFLKVSWLSEITTADGRHIEESVLRTPFCGTSRPEFLYPNQVLPPSSSWQIWKEALSKLSSDGRLRRPLGPFLRTDTVAWWLDNSAMHLYQVKHDGTFARFRKAPGTRTRANAYKFIFSDNATELPHGVLPASATIHRSTQAYLTGLGHTTELPHTNVPTNWILRDVQFPDNLQEEWNNRTGDVRAVSDGSFKNAHGTAAWIIFISNRCIIKGRAIAPGHPDDQSAYRSELTGLYGIVMTIRHLEKHFHLTGDITVGCDGLSALTKASIQSDFINPNEPQFDLIMAIRHARQESSWSWNWKHVKGHQDVQHAFHELDEWSHWNIMMDSEAKAYWVASQGVEVHDTIVGEPWQTFVNGKKITSSMRHALREACTSSPALLYWLHKKRFGAFTPNEIDWDSFSAAMAATPVPRQHWVSKTITGFCATGRMMVRRRERTSDACPRCGEPEDIEHVWQCTSDTDAIWTTALLNLKVWMDDNCTHPKMRDAILSGLNSWHYKVQDPFKTSIPWLHELYVKQQNCGWRNFFEGLLLSDWRDAIQDYHQKLASKKSPKRWISALIRKMWMIAWDLWEHRNGHLHNKEVSLLTQQVDLAISDQFSIGYADLDGSTRALFRGGLPAVLAKPLDVKQQWLRRIQQARSNVALGKTFQSERQVMAQWLGTYRKS